MAKKTGVPFCANDPCEAEATKFYRTEDGAAMPLCTTCGDAFELGQANHQADLLGIEMLDPSKTICPECHKAVLTVHPDFPDHQWCPNPKCDVLWTPKELAEALAEEKQNAD